MMAFVRIRQPLRRCSLLGALGLIFTVALSTPVPAAEDGGELEDAAELTPEIQRAIDKGLKYLASIQQRDGSFRGSNGRSTAIVGAACIAFMGDGHHPGRGRYGPVVARGMQYLIRNSTPEGLLHSGGGGGVMYHHGLALLALSEAWGMTQDERIREAVRRGVDLLVRTQNHDGGWRYHPRVERGSDISVTVMQLMALRACYEAGIYVPKEVIDRGIEYVKKCHNGKQSGGDGGFVYTPGRKDSGIARTGAGVLSLQVSGNYRAREVVEGLDYLMSFQPIGDKDPGKSHFYYGNYYATMAIYQSQSLGSWGKRAWRLWYPNFSKKLIARQRDNGSFHGGHGLYGTATAILLLEVPKRFLPIYQR